MLSALKTFRMPLKQSQALWRKASTDKLIVTYLILALLLMAAKHEMV